MTQNQNSPRFDITTYLPVGVGAVSLFGICLLLVASRLAAPRAIVEVPDTPTPFRYLLIGTEPGISTVAPIDEFLGTREVGFAVTAQSGFSSSGDSSIVEPTEIIPQTTEDSSADSSSATATVRPGLPTVTSSRVTNTPIGLPPVTGGTDTFNATATRPVTVTSTSVGPAPLIAGTYDDTDSHLTYAGSWINQADESLHVSPTIGNTVTFRFIGDQLRIVYQSGVGLGIMAATIDGVAVPSEDQSSGDGQWVISGLDSGLHFVTLTHSSGGSVNIDEVIVLDVLPVNTPVTPTTTP